MIGACAVACGAVILLIAGADASIVPSTGISCSTLLSLWAAFWKKSIKLSIISFAVFGIATVVFWSSAQEHWAIQQRAAAMRDIMTVPKPGYNGYYPP
jgi:hypothetical protein